jgi:predicted RNA-binding Zn-ribbon protein involved in translation (DUF1610 family)
MARQLAAHYPMSRRFQFNLKWLFVAMLVVAAFFAGMTLDRITEEETVAIYHALQESQAIEELTRQRLIKAEMLLEQHDIEQHGKSQSDVLVLVNSGLAMKCPNCGDSERQQQVLWNEHPLGYRCAACGRVYMAEKADLAALAARLEELKIKQAELRKVMNEMESLIRSAGDH